MGEEMQVVVYVVGCFGYRLLRGDSGADGGLDGSGCEFPHPIDIRAVRDTMVEGERSSSAGVAEALGNSSEPKFESASDGIRQGDSEIKIHGAKSSSNCQDSRVAWDRNHFVDGGVSLPELRQMGFGQEGNMSGRESLAETDHGRRGHDGVAQPVHPAH